MSGHLHLSAGIHRGGQKLLQKQSFQFPSLRPGHWNKMKRKWGNRERGKGQTRRKRENKGGRQIRMRKGGNKEEKLKNKGERRRRNKERKRRKQRGERK